MREKTSEFADSRTGESGQLRKIKRRGKRSSGNGADIMQKE